MKRILFIAHEPFLNGASKSLINIINELKKRSGYKIYVLTAFNKGEFYTELKKCEINIIYSPFYICFYKKNDSLINRVKMLCKWYLRDLYRNTVTAKKVAKYIKDEKIDIIHTNTSVLDIGARINKYAQIKHVMHLREFGDLDFNLRTLYKKSKYEKLILNNTDKFICISRAIFNHYSYIPKNKKIVVYNGVDKENILERNYANFEYPLKLLIVGRNIEAKGIALAVEAISKLSVTYKNKILLYIAGLESKDLQLSENVKDMVKPLGYCSNMSDIRKTINLELVCSRAEAFGRVTVEAMLGGIPVIGNSTGGTLELINDGENGFLFKENSVDDLVDKIKLFLDNNILIEKIGKQAQKYAMGMFLIDKCVSNLCNLYELL